MKLTTYIFSFAMTAATASSSWAVDGPGNGVTVRPIEGTVLEERFQNQIIYSALSELGYEIGDPQSVEYQTIHLAIGAGDGDFTTVHYDPLHQAFFEESGGEDAMRRVGHLIRGAVQGYLVDKGSYDAGITNLEDLKDPEIAARFDANDDGTADLAGCPPGWGCERVIEHHLTEFGMRDTVTHNQGAYNAVIADTIARQSDGSAVIYYTWTPYWVSGVMVPGQDVEWLEVPYSSLPDGRSGDTTFDGRELGFAVNELRILANADFLDANPAAEKLFELAEIPINDVSAQNYKMQQGEDSIEQIDAHVAEWIAAHQQEFDGWIAAARAAAE
ncbi:glycine betaine/L-proline ABC transporter substrate-binding protein ProX [Pseudohalocynthiibacter aestuariivivens]|uniref:Glycine betaine/L-proline ABC transporter substrate-binding protein ProX n=1 Tax=Roseovarius pelagicus TaxID=2980108 RepID=A0ABY6DCY2_9RHOB|nr:MULTISPECIES: glycine betaine/L-proline ABC transporter substrate-binding protein ProX [Rhodobacterales]QIE45234.1 glycine betaine/L-proline ABC transporter substrate-binding protein ProX [Pseudohalocynthiibacter aestuariivivens]UXX82858.1 glycine betaine/L-proline ABC transporter substrate-binding protein ProX [Roseovarius pelagicus]